MINPDTQQQLRQRFNPDGSTLRLSQLRMLEILLHVDRVCRDNGISYWLSSGTLIGAVRHGGFIPWDDDVDIEMLSADYQKLIALLGRKECAGKYQLCTSATDPNFLFPYAKLHDPDSIIEEATGLDALQRYRGCFIDIFPLAPSGSLKAHRLSAKVLGTELKLAVATQNRGLKNQLVHVTSQKVLYPLLRWANKLKAGSRLRHTIPSFFHAQRNLKDIYPLSEVEFEGHRLLAPGNTDAYLTKLYGDYMLLPNIENIHTHAAKITILPQNNERFSRQ
ncbi:MAG: LicD family protein [Muribaculum sp.]|nr:LicD family protein [Muribaculaceae bacterium]MCM1081586.1 LicD family protein [Muribaculum sp.]